MIFSKRLRIARKKNMLTQEELSKHIGVGKTTISNYETGYSMPDPETLIRLAYTLGVSTDYLLGQELADAPVPSKTNMPLGNQKRVDLKDQEKDVLETIETVKIPVYNLGFFKGEDILADSNIIGWHDVPAKYMKCIAFRVYDDSMTGSRMYPGDTIWVDTSIEPKDNSLVVVKVKDGSALIRKINYANDEVILSPTNSEHQLQIFHNSEIELIGVVIKINIDIPY